MVIINFGREKFKKSRMEESVCEEAIEN